jgi:hypothetical protein
MAYLVNEKFNTNLSQGYIVGDTVLYLDQVPDNVPTILLLDKDGDNETKFSCQGKSGSTVTGVARISGANANLDQGTAVTCLTHEEFINQFQYIASGDMQGEKLINVADPTEDQDAATKVYVDTEIEEIPAKVITLTNKRIEPRIVTAASYTTNTGTSLDVSTADIFQVTAQAGALLFNAPGGTPVAGQKLIIRIKDNGTARALTYNAIFRASSDLALPTTTILGKTLYMGFIYNLTDTKWDLLAVLNNI